MVNREWISAALTTFTNALDDYGQPRKTVSTTQTIQVTNPRYYKHTQVEDIRFQDVTDFCLAPKDVSISDANELTIGTVTYLINFVINEGRLQQLFLIKK